MDINHTFIVIRHEISPDGTVKIDVVRGVAAVVVEIPGWIYLYDEQSLASNYPELDMTGLEILEVKYELLGDEELGDIEIINKVPIGGRNERYKSIFSR